MSQGEHLAPPRAAYINPEYSVPLSPPARPPFSHHHSSATLPNTPHTPFPPPHPATFPAASSPSQSALRPYIGLPARILLVTLSPALLPLILTIAHLIQNRSSTASLADSLRASVISACSGLATGAAALTTMPRYLAMQTNEQAVRATQATVLAVGAALVDCVTIMEVVVTFIVDTYRSMLLCTIELAVRGTLELLIGTVKTITDGVTSSLNSIRSGIQNDISSANEIIQSAVDKVNWVTSKININISVPEFSIPSLSALENVTIPTGFEDSLIKLNQTLPTLSELKEKMDSLIEKPFELLKSEVNATRFEIAASFNNSMLPVPALAQLSAAKKDEINNDLCSNLDTSLIDDTARSLHKLSNVAIGLMFLMLFLVWAALVIWEWRRWKALTDTVETLEDEWKRDETRDAWRAVAIVENPILEKYGSPVLRRVAPNARTRNNLRWYMSYLAHPTCLALLFIALLGFFSIQFQLVALDAIKAHARENANATVAQSTNSLTAKLNDMAMASSQQYATDFNNAMDEYQKRIDEELFGTWLNTTAVTLNSTLVEFYAGIEEALNATFGGTILFNPINTFMYCILGSKIDNLEQGLTWVAEHAMITLPKLPNDVLLLSNSSMNEIAQPISAAAVGGGTDGDDQGAVGSLISHFESALAAERMFYAILLGIWLASALFGLIAVIWHSGGADRFDQLREERGWKRTDPSGPGVGAGGVARYLPWIKTHPIYDEYTVDEKHPHSWGTSPVPRIVEPDDASFFNYGRGGSPAPSHNPNPDREYLDIPTRPFVPRKGTFGSIVSLAAPGQAWLKLTGIGKPEDERALTEGASEKYNSASYIDTRLPDHRDRDDTTSSRVETQPPIWVDRWYRAVEGAKSLFPTRGQRHGAAIARNASMRTDRSFGASQVPTPILAGWDEPEHHHRVDEDGQWAIDTVGPEPVGVALDGMNDGRYPTMSRSAPTTTPVYPRRLSRAPTLPDGPLVSRNIFDDPPPLPSKHDSIDYLYDDDDYDHPPEREREVISPTSTATSYAYNDAHLESANRVQTGTAALAAILANMDRNRHPSHGQSQGPGHGYDPFATPFDEERRGGMI